MTSNQPTNGWNPASTDSALSLSYIDYIHPAPSVPTIYSAEKNGDLRYTGLELLKPNVLHNRTPAALRFFNPPHSLSASLSLDDGVGQ